MEGGTVKALFAKQTRYAVLSAQTQEFLFSVPCPVRCRPGGTAVERVLTQAGDCLPVSPVGILHNEGIWGEDLTVVFNGLTYEHPIERVSMEGRQLVEMKDGTFVER